MTTTEPRRRLVRIATIEQETGASRSTINRLINAGHLVRVKIGRASAITVDSYDTWIASLPRDARKAA